ncbi:HutD family protein, partial [Mesorhizobium sp. M7A.F.Ca.CA.002.15.1.1]
ISVPAAEPVRLGPLDTLLSGPVSTGLLVQPAHEATLYVIRIRAIAGND